MTKRKQIETETLSQGDRLTKKIKIEKEKNVALHNNLLLISAKKGVTEIVKLLLDHGVSPDICDSDGNSALHLAAEHGNTQDHWNVVELLLKSDANPNAQDSCGYTPLHLAAQNGHWHIVELLIDNKAEVNAKTNTDGDTPLHLAAENGHETAVESLLKKKANVNEKNYCGYTPLHFAVLDNHHGVLRLLLKNKAEVNSETDENKLNPLHDAVKYGMESTKLLLESGASPNAQDSHGYTPLHYLTKKDDIDEFSLMTYLLLSYKANPNIQDNKGLTALHYAVKKSRYFKVELLLKHRADAHIQDNDGNTPLSIAQGNNTEMYEFLNNTEMYEFLNNTIEAITNDGQGEPDANTLEQISSFFNTESATDLEQDTAQEIIGDNWAVVTQI